MPGNEDIRSVRRALDILELLGTSPSGLAPWQIVQALHVGKATAHRLIRTIFHKGLIERTGHPTRYKLAKPLRGIRHDQADWNRRFLRPAIAQAIRLARATDSHIYVSQFIGGVVLARFRSFRNDPDEINTPYGWRLMPYGSALIFQAYMKQEQLKDYRTRNPLNDSDREYWKSVAMVDEFLPMVRAGRCAAFTKGGMSRAAAAVFGSGPAPIGALAMVRPVEAPPEPAFGECVRMLRDAAIQLTRSIQRGPGQSKLAANLSTQNSLRHPYDGSRPRDAPAKL